MGPENDICDLVSTTGAQHLDYEDLQLTIRLLSLLEQHGRPRLWVDELLKGCIVVVLDGQLHFGIIERVKLMQKEEAVFQLQDGNMHPFSAISQVPFLSLTDHDLVNMHNRLHHDIFIGTALRPNRFVGFCPLILCNGIFNGSSLTLKC